MDYATQSRRRASMGSNSRGETFDEMIHRQARRSSIGSTSSRRKSSIGSSASSRRQASMDSNSRGETCDEMIDRQAKRSSVGSTSSRRQASMDSNSCGETCDEMIHRQARRSSIGSTRRSSMGSWTSSRRQASLNLIDERRPSLNHKTHYMDDGLSLTTDEVRSSLQATQTIIDGVYCNQKTFVDRILYKTNVSEPHR